MSNWPGFDLHAELIADVERRFWGNVVKTEACWLWAGELDDRGYGKFAVAGRTWTASVVSWALHNGPVPAMRLVCHHCDNPPCIRPEHLFLGDHSMNRIDANLKAADPQGALQASVERIEARMQEIRRGAAESRQARIEARRRKGQPMPEALGIPMQFTDDEVRQIRAAGDYMGVNTHLAKQFHVSRQAIAAIRRRETYRHVSDMPGTATNPSKGRRAPCGHTPTRSS